MKRVHLFEFEDFSWFPAWLRNCITRYLAALHELLDTQAILTPLIRGLLEITPNKKLIDLCSGSGGPLPGVVEALRVQGVDFELTMSDLYPNHEIVEQIRSRGIHYEKNPVDATAVRFDGARTLICSFHHMPPDLARSVLKNAYEEKKPLCIFEITDNAWPIFLFWTVMPFAFGLVLLLTPRIRGVTWQQIVFTYLVPIVPLVVAWDAAISNVRTYTLADMAALTTGLDDGYVWEGGKINGRGPGKMLYFLGQPMRTTPPSHDRHDPCQNWSNER